MEENTKDADDVKIYELGYHVLPTVAEENVAEEVGKIHSFISENDGNIISEGMPTKHQLSYEIKKRIETKYVKFNKAYFGWVKFEITPALVGKIKEKMTSDENILRFIIINTVKENTMHVFKSPMMSKDEMVRVPKDLPAQAVKTEISEEEIDKSIDELVINQTL